MNKNAPLLLTLALTPAGFAEHRPALEIVKMLDLALFPIPPDPDLDEKGRTAELERRRLAQANADRVMAERLEKQMSAAELKQTLAFLQSPAGRKFHATLNGKPLLDEIDRIADGKDKAAAGAGAADIANPQGSWKHVSSNGELPPVQSTFTFQAGGQGFVEIARKRGKEPLKLVFEYEADGKSLVVSYKDEDLHGQQERGTYSIKGAVLTIEGMNQGAVDKFERIPPK